MDIKFIILSLTHHGGVKVLIQLANYMSSVGFNVEIITSTKNLSPYHINKDVKITTIFNSIANKHIRFVFFSIFSPFYLKSDLVIASHFFTVFPAKLGSLIYKARAFFFVQGFEAECFNIESGVIRKFFILLNDLAFKLLPVVSANKYLSMRLRNVCKVAHDFNLGVPLKWLIKSDIHVKNHDVVYFLRSEKNKGLDRFIDIANKNKHIKFLCVGQDRSVFDGLNGTGNILFFKPKNDSELYQAIDSSKVLLLTSYKEGFSLPPLEAMFRGVPLIYFDCGGPSVYTDLDNSVEIKCADDFHRAFTMIDTNYAFYKEAALNTAKKNILEDSLKLFLDYLLVTLKNN